MTMDGAIIPGAGRNPGEEYGRYHLYRYVDHICGEGCDAECQERLDLLPMCIYGWNRSNGFAFSILRSNTSSRGECKLCRRNVEQGKSPAEPSEHKTAWL